MGIAADILGLGRRMSIRNAFIASIALVFGIAWLGEASAQSSLPPCQPDAYVWDRCIGTDTKPDGSKYVGQFRDGRYDGQGTFTYRDGRKQVGQFRDGKLVSNAYYGPNATDSLRVENGGRVKMVESGGIYQVPVLINDELKLNFIVDSGASDVSIPSDVVLTLIRTGTIKKSDFIGTEEYRLADGSPVESKTFIVRSLKVGDRTVTDEYRRCEWSLTAWAIVPEQVQVLVSGQRQPRTCSSVRSGGDMDRLSRERLKSALTRGARRPEEEWAI